MKKAAIYCRVSTEDQEREGTSLQSQLEACKKLAQERGYEVPEEYIISEVYSGLSLDRPELARLRQWVRDRELDTVIGYSTDRLSRDPVHLLLLAEEFDKRHVELTFVTEPLDNSMEGQLLSFVRGWASKLEAIKIAERTMRGKRMRTLAGKLPGGSHARLYGYHYIKGKGDGRGIRVINEDEANWVRQMFRWLVEEGLSLRAITLRLRTLGVPRPNGGHFWARSAVYYILTNPAYCGKTYAFTYTYTEPQRPRKSNPKRRKTHIVWKPREEWVEIPHATPPIISEELFEAAQAKLRRNKELSLRNARRQYLLRGHVYCRKCGRRYWGNVTTLRRGDKHYSRRFYNCSGNSKVVSPAHCGNRIHSAQRLETVVWEQVEALLSKPELVSAELRRRQGEAEEASFLERDLEAIAIRLHSLQKRELKLIRAYEFGFEEEAVRKEKAMLDEERKQLQEDRLQIERRIEASRQFKVDIDSIKKACELVKQNLASLSFEHKKMALEALQVRAWIDGDNVTIEGVIPIAEDDIVSCLSPQAYLHLYAYTKAQPLQR